MRTQPPKLKSIIFNTHHLKAPEGFPKKENVKIKQRFDDHFIKTTENFIVSISSTTLMK